VGNRIEIKKGIEGMKRIKGIKRLRCNALVITLSVIMLTGILILTSCTTYYDPLANDLYTKNIYPGLTDTYDMGSALLQWKNGHFQTIFVNGVPLVPGTSIIWRGAWVSMDPYVVGDAVSYLGSSYYCLLAVTSNVLPDVDPAHWGVLAVKGTDGADGADGADGQGYTWQGAWDNTNVYVPYDVVQFMGSTYNCILTTVAIPYDGDVNSDGVANILDILVVVTHMGESGAPGWIPSDVDLDGTITTDDTDMIGTIMAAQPPGDAISWQYLAQRGADGADGADGAAGVDGKTVLNGAGAPGAGLGVNGDFYIDTTASALYGPKAGGAWGAGTNLIGADGANGTNGTNGLTILNGAGAPGAGLGVNGDFYIDTTAKTIYGPKAGGAWGGATSIIGPAGADGAAGPNTVTAATTTDLTGILTGDGANVGTTTLTGYVPYAGGNQNIHINSGYNIDLVNALTSDLTWSGLTSAFTAGEALSIWNVVYINASSKLAKANGSAVATMPVIALTTATVDNNAVGVFLTYGYARNDAWTWTINGNIYVSAATAGLMTQTPPAGSGNQVQLVGIAITQDIIMFNPNSMLLELR
jgi:hypothetical protein